MNPLEKPLFPLVVKRNKINLLIYQQDLEKIVEWIIHDNTLRF
jgi:hypothetical protein